MNYSKVCLDYKGNYFITLYLNHKRFRLYIGDKIGIDLNQIVFPFFKEKQKLKSLQQKFINISTMAINY